METINKFFKNNLQKIITVVIVIIFISVFSFILEDSKIIKKEVENINYIKIAGKTLKVELALTTEAQEKGLSGRNSLKEDEGMLFIFSQPSKNYFWMKDMNFSIDIIWINKEMKVIFVEKNVDPNTYPQTFGPNEETLYVLEVNAGFSEKNNLRQGDKIEFLSS